MVSSWGGYVFLINLIPLHVSVFICIGRFSNKIYIAYSTISFFGFRCVQTSEHMMAFGVFGLCQIIAFANCLRTRMSEENFQFLFRSTVLFAACAVAMSVIVASYLGKIAPWTRRFYSLLDPSCAKNNIPIIASVSEHQPTAWSSFYFDLQILGVMVRLMLVLAPVMYILGGVALSSILITFMKNLDSTSTHARHDKKEKERNYPYNNEQHLGPSIVLSACGGDGSTIISDDFREAYCWLRKNTHPEAKIMSWWDYGYQIIAMANRTIIVDNSTWNNTHISRVRQALSSKEEDAYEIMRELDVDYVLVIFGGVIGYSSHDINKFLWMVRIGGSTPE
uniref:Dolichyl-diphosphooligosaccharide--protein glycosyltransferase subunit STT3A n=1 Tax=Wuchereria bancrofti TaxID=6293 RepID=A0A1I8ESV4_WUCBA